ncbi:MAG: hypothetical protein RL325_1966 [Planctomycetota bacterium]|jgi:hypothetical protein
MRPIALFSIASIALAVAGAASAQSQVQGNRVGTQVGGTRMGGPSTGGGLADPTLSGRGQGLGDGNALGGQTFRWSQTAGAGRASGSGNILDANPQLGAGGANSGSIPVDYSARNLLVTGSVPGGRGFRGSVGYTADKDFAARTGSDDLYLFRADSAFSNPTFANSPFARDRFLVAQGLGVFEYRRESTPATVDNPSMLRDQPESRLRLDRANAQMSFGRGNWEINADRTIATTTSTRNEPLRYVISPLRGLQIENMTDPLTRGGLGLYERARARQDIATGIMTLDDYKSVRAGMSVEPTDPRRVDKRLRPETESERLRLDGAKVLPKSYLDILDIINKDKPETPKPEGAPAADGKTNLDKVREALEPLRPKPRPEAINTDPTKSSTGDTARGSLVSPEGTPRSAEADREASREKQRGVEMSVEDAARILRHRQTINELGRDDKRRVDELVKQGEAALREGDYFRAERRFEQAQGLAADNPLTDAGIAHAQLGAGLYLSASLTLRNLFTSFPELIDAKYDRALLPAQDRLDTAIGTMRQRMQRGDEVAGYGLVLAYIGHQTGDRALVAEGLAGIGGNEKLDTTRKLLEGVWLGTK